MRKRFFPIAVAAAFMIAAVARADHPLVDKVADRVVQKYQTSSCAQLAADKVQRQGRPKSAAEQRAVQLLHEDAAARTEFFNKISAPVVTKLFECGMIP